MKKQHSETEAKQMLENNREKWEFDCTPKFLY